MSGVLAVVTALHAAFADAVAPAEVFYGPPAASEWHSDLTAWVATNVEGPDITVTAGPRTEAGDQVLTVRVACALVAYSGGSDVQVALATLDGADTALRARLNGDRTLDGVAQNAEFGTDQDIVIARDSGVRVLSSFTVEVTTWST